MADDDVTASPDRRSHHDGGDAGGDRGAFAGKRRSLPAPQPFRNLVAQARLGISREEHEAYFREMLGEVEEPTAPFGLLDVQGDGTGIAQAYMKVEAGLARRIRERARKLGVSAASLCHVAWAQVLARTSGREDVVFGTVLLGACREEKGRNRQWDYSSTHCR